MTYQAPNGEAALLNQQERPSGLHYKILAFCWAGWLFDFYDLMLFSTTQHGVAASLGLSEMQVSTVIGTSLASTALGGIMFGWLADRYGRRPVLQATILTYSLGALLVGLAPGYATLLLARVVTGLGVGGEWATGQMYVGETFPPRLRGRFGAVMQTGAPVGVALAAVMGSFFAPAFGWRATFLISALPALLVVFIRRGIPESDVWLARERLAAEGRLPEDEQLLSRRARLLQLLAPDLRRLFACGLVLTILDMSAYWFTYSWLPKYLQQRLGGAGVESVMALHHAGIWMLVNVAGGLLGYLTFGVVADRLGRRPAFTIFATIWALALVPVTIFWDAFAGQPRLLLACLFAMGFGTGSFGGYGPLFAEIFPTRVRNTATGTAFNLARGVQFGTPLLITVVASRYGLSGGISLAAFFALATGLWVWTLPETRGKALGVV
ncbi:MAG: MFS transporter [Deltaproteobacteria bacterium]|nr:MFS transporter [Deltaproteobacteria bacterium]